MRQILYHSTNDVFKKVNFETALLNGMAPDYGLYMVCRKDIPKLSASQIGDMKGNYYPEIASRVLSPYLSSEIPEKELKPLIEQGYNTFDIPTIAQHVTGRTYILWLTNGPTYSFKDYAARFFGRVLNYFLEKRNKRKAVIVATSGDTGGAVADALHGLESVDNLVFFPKGEISERQRRQMTTLKDNIYAFEVNGDFDACQALAKNLLGDKQFAEGVFGDKERFTSANSISIGRLLPQSVFPFFAYSRIAKNGEKMTVSIPSGNFGNLVGTVLAREMGLPIEKIIVALNPNKPFLDFLETGEYKVSESIKTPSSAMRVSHPSNLVRLIDLYGGHMFDKRDEEGKVIQQGVIDKMPDLDAMRKDFFAFSVSNKQHYQTMKRVFENHGITIDPHTSVGWLALESYLKGKHDKPAVVYATADPGKFPKDVKKAIGGKPRIPSRISEQKSLTERVYTIDSTLDSVDNKLKLSDAQVEEAKEKISEIFS